MQFLKGRGVPTAICTRNNLQPVEYLIENFLPDHTFDPVQMPFASLMVDNNALFRASKTEPSSDLAYYEAMG